jgi:hypothetical protein
MQRHKALSGEQDKEGGQIDALAARRVLVAPRESQSECSCSCVLNCDAMIIINVVAIIDTKGNINMSIDIHSSCQF